MAIKKKPTPNVKPRSKPAPAPTRLQNLAAKSPSFDDGDEQLVDHSGVFRVTSSIAQAQAGHEEAAARLFPSDSVVMRAVRDPREDDDPIAEPPVEDEAAQAVRNERRATLAARVRSRR